MTEDLPPRLITASVTDASKIHSDSVGYEHAQQILPIMVHVVF